MIRPHLFRSTSMALAIAGALSVLNAQEAAAPTEPAAPSADSPTAPPPADATPKLDELPLHEPGQPPAGPSAELVGKPAPSQNAMVNLLNILVAKGNLTRQEGNALIQQAEQDAEIARAEAAAAAADPVDDNDVRVTYVPEIVRSRIRDEIKDEVLDAARNEKWGMASNIPEWTERYQPFGDIRLRYETLSYDSGNDNTGAFPNFNAINTGAPFDISGNVFSPQYNVDTDRARMRFRARLGAEIDLGENWTAGLRIATGENNSPITTNQSMGLASQGQGGNFSKYAIWLDRAFFKVDMGDARNRNVALYFGRFDNPFFSSDIIFDEDLGFDGVAIKGRYELFERVTPFIAASASPIFNTDLNFSSNQPAKFQSTDKWLYAIQAGFDLALTKKLDLKFGTGYFNFEGVEGELSDPYTPLTASDAGNTDNTRPSFSQKGNTYTPLRNIIPSALNSFGTTQQFQYFGLATPFQVLTFTGELTFNNWEPFQISLKGEYAKNLAFKQLDLESKAVNNRGPIPVAEPATAATTAATTTTAADGTTTTTAPPEPTPVGEYEGGDTAWMVNLQIGKKVFEKRGDWNAFVGYRYVESDAVIDGFNDSEFGGGGTNVKGFIVGGNVAVSKRVKVGLNWMSANQIAGPPLKSDTFFFDIGAKF